jgi:hypothetical protein
MESLAVWLKGTALSAFITSYPWIWPACETLHFIGLAMVVGITGFFDFRLMGFMKRVPIGAAKDLMPWALVGFGINLVTGVIFFVGEPGMYVGNDYWNAKLLFLFLAGLNALCFELTIGRRTSALAPGEDTPLSAKMFGLLSLVLWLGVLYWGRLLPFSASGL